MSKVVKTTPVKRGPISNSLRILYLNNGISLKRCGKIRPINEKTPKNDITRPVRKSDTNMALD